MLSTLVRLVVKSCVILFVLLLIALRSGSLLQHQARAGQAAPKAEKSESSDGATVVPADRRVKWEPGVTAGVLGGIPADRNNLVDVTKDPYLADKTGAADAQPAIQAAINKAKSGDVVYLPAGTYRLERGLYIPSTKKNFTIRGDGEKTVVDVRCGGTAIHVAGDAWNPFNVNRHKSIAITGGLTKGSGTLTVADASAFAPGQLLQITELNDPELPVMSVGGPSERLRKQKSTIVSKTATTVTISPPLYWTLKSALKPEFLIATQTANGVGIEDLRIDAKESKAGFLIRFEAAIGCWIQNVHSTMAANYHYSISHSLHCEVRHCFLDRLNHVGSNGAGLLVDASSACLFEDNIIFKCFPHIEVNAGCSGNVYAFNFAEGNEVFGIMGCAINCNHGPHNSYELYEGNICSVFQSDGYFGGASEITAFRNWFHGTCDTSEPKTDRFGRCVALNRFSRNFSLVGNVLGRTGHTYLYDNADAGTNYTDRFIYNFGLPNMGNGAFKGHGPPWKDPLKSAPGPSGFQELDRDVLKTTLLKGNWNAKDAAIPKAESLGESTLPNSLFRTSKPPWFGKLNWPPFDPNHPNQSYEAIPAGYRFKHGIDPPDR